MAIDLLVAAIAATAVIIAVTGTSSRIDAISRDSCQVWEFIADRFLAPTKTETAHQKAITRQFGDVLNGLVTGCRAAGYGVKP